MPDEPVEPYLLRWTDLARVLETEANNGEWGPFTETDIGPLASITAEALMNGFDRLGLRLVAVEATDLAPAGRPVGDGEHSDTVGQTCDRWQGPTTVAHGRVFHGFCTRCGWPRPDHHQSAGTGRPGHAARG